MSISFLDMVKQSDVGEVYFLDYSIGRIKSG